MSCELGVTARSVRGVLRGSFVRIHTHTRRPLAYGRRRLCRPPCLIIVARRFSARLLLVRIARARARWANEDVPQQRRLLLRFACGGFGAPRERFVPLPMPPLRQLSRQRRVFLECAECRPQRRVERIRLPERQRFVRPRVANATAVVTELAVADLPQHAAAIGARESGRRPWVLLLRPF